MQVKGAELVNYFADNASHLLYYLIVIVLDDERSQEIRNELLLYRLLLQVLENLEYRLDHLDPNIAFLVVKKLVDFWQVEVF